MRDRSQDDHDRSVIEMQDVSSTDFAGSSSQAARQSTGKKRSQSLVEVTPVDARMDDGMDGDVPVKQSFELSTNGLLIFWGKELCR